MLQEGWGFTRYWIGLNVPTRERTHRHRLRHRLRDSETQRLRDTECQTNTSAYRRGDPLLARARLSSGSDNCVPKSQKSSKNAVPMLPRAHLSPRERLSQCHMNTVVSCRAVDRGREKEGGRLVGEGEERQRVRVRDRDRDRDRLADTNTERQRPPSKLRAGFLGPVLMVEPTNNVPVAYRFPHGSSLSLDFRHRSCFSGDGV